MSVPEPLRRIGRLEVHVKAQYLASYTIKILANDKTFPPEVDGELVKRIKDSAISIYAKAWSANKINASTNKVNREMRYRLQREAWMLCNELLAYIGIAKQVFHLREKWMKATKAGEAMPQKETVGNCSNGWTLTTTVYGGAKHVHNSAERNCTFAARE